MFPALFEPLLTLFFPAHCAGCAVVVAEGYDFCPTCESTIEFIKTPRCQICSQPFDGMAGEFECPNCRGAAFHFEFAVCVVRSRGAIRELIHRLKYHREIWIVSVLARILAHGLADERFSGEQFDAIVPVPLHSKRLREREFNQSALLAARLSRVTGIPVRDVLARSRYTGTQTALDRSERRQNLRNAFSLRKNASVTDQNLLLIDDVLTTGSTLDACASVLLEQGAESVRALTLARG
ncbi:MAG: ComF family protein [Spartobacteria bacterium]